MSRHLLLVDFSVSVRQILLLPNRKDRYSAKDVVFVREAIAEGVLISTLAHAISQSSSCHRVVRRLRMLRPSSPKKKLSSYILTHPFIYSSVRVTVALIHRCWGKVFQPLHQLVPSCAHCQSDGQSVPDALVIIGKVDVDVKAHVSVFAF